MFLGRSFTRRPPEQRSPTPLRHSGWSLLLRTRLTTTPPPSRWRFAVTTVKVSPTSINFGTVYLGSIVVKNVTVTNLGSNPVTIKDPLISLIRNGDSKEFVAINLCPKPLAGHKSCDITVSFIAGPVYNQQTATLEVMDSSPGSPQPVSLTALTIDPKVQLSATSLSFGTQKERDQQCG